MKRNDIKSLSQKTPVELLKQLQELKVQVAKTRLELSVGKLQDIRLPSKLSDDIARIKTVLSQQEFVTQNQTQVENEAKKSKKTDESK